MNRIEIIFIVFFIICIISSNGLVVLFYERQSGVVVYDYHCTGDFGRYYFGK